MPCAGSQLVPRHRGGQELQPHGLAGPRLHTPTPEQAQLPWEARLDWPLEQGAKHPAGDQERKPGHRGDQRYMLFVHFSRAKRQDVPLMHNLAHAGQRLGIVRACSGAPGLSPLSPGPGVPPHSPLDAESQYNSIMTLQGLLALVCGTGIPHLTGNTRQQLEPRAGCQHPEQETGWLSLGHCLPGPRAWEAWLGK